MEEKKYKKKTSAPHIYGSSTGEHLTLGADVPANIPINVDCAKKTLEAFLFHITLSTKYRNPNSKPSTEDLLF